MSFNHAKFGEGDVTFTKASFGEGDVGFNHTSFGEGNVFFDDAIFGEGHVSFNHAKFGEGNVFLSNITFGEGDVTFTNTSFGEGDVGFTKSSFGEGYVNFDFAKFQGAVIFGNLRDIAKTKSFSFQYCTFDAQFVLSSAEEFPCLVDLTGTKISHQPLLDDLKCRLPDSDKITKGDISRARRLKELAENNADHQKAQDFHVLEMQAKKILNPPKNKLLSTDFWFEALSDYGRSITAPLLHLLYTWFVFAVLYDLALQGFKTTFDNFLSPFIFSKSQMFGFLPSSRTYTAQFCKSLEGFVCPDWLFAITSVQTIISLMLLFLLGLGLRHRYRV